VAKSAAVRVSRSTKRAPDAHAPFIGSPLTERVFDRLGPPRWLWIVLWGLAPLAQIPIVIAVFNLSGKSTRSVPTLVIPQAVLAYVVILLLWGLGRLMRQARDLQTTLRRLTAGQDEPDTMPGIASVAGPILMTGALAVVSTAATWISAGPLLALADLPLLALTVLPIMTFVHTYLALLMGLDRLGRHRLALDPFPHDRSLGLGPVGALAFTGFWLVFAAAIPIILSSSGSDLTVLESYAVLAVSVAVFFLSMWRLHRQMAAAKARYLHQTRDLYAAAYEPVRVSGTLETLQAQAPVLGAAQALEERAASILTWPISDQLMGIIIFVVAGVASGIIVRFAFLAAKL
jgi:hypothetical protein